MNRGRTFLTVAIAVASGLWCAAATAQDDTGTLETSSAPAGDQVIHLHMPVHHRPRHNEPKPAPESPAPASIDAIHEPSAESMAPAVVPSAAPQKTVAPGASPAKTAARATATKSAPTIPFSFGEDSEEAPTAAPPPASPVKTAAIPPHAATVHAPSSPGTADDHAGLAKRGAVMFEKGVSDPSPTQFKGVKLLAGDLSAALESGATRVQLEAYGGAPGDKSSDARRLSLKRALAVRQLLIDNGVPSSRIDVRAMGGIDDKGPTDRVDVFVRTG